MNITYNPEYKINKSLLILIRGDITKQDTDAIVNAANNALSPGGGVSGAIHRAAGPKLWDESKRLGGCNTGEAKITRGYELPARYVIHTVGPVYSGSLQDKTHLANCYKNSLELARSRGLNSISFPSISTGIFGYPVKDASEVAIKTIYEYLQNNTKVKEVRMVLFSNEDSAVYRSSAEMILG